MSSLGARFVLGRTCLHGLLGGLLSLAVLLACLLVARVKVRLDKRSVGALATGRAGTGLGTRLGAAGHFSCLLIRLLQKNNKPRMQKSKHPRRESNPRYSD